MSMSDESQLQQLHPFNDWGHRQALLQFNL